MPYICGLGPFLLIDPNASDNRLHGFAPISDNGKEHVTISFRETEFDDTDFIEHLTSLICVSVTGEALFGPNEDIPVYTVEFDDYCRSALLSVHDLTEQRSMLDFVPTAYNPHITRKHLNRDLSPGTQLFAQRVFIKEVGSEKPPLYERWFDLDAYAEETAF